MPNLKLTTVGSSTGVVLPKQMLERLRLHKGDTLYALETPNGYEITPYDPQFAQQMDIVEKVAHKRRNVLKKLAQ